MDVEVLMVISHLVWQIRLDLHSFGTERIITTDATTGTTTIIIPSNGSCQARNFGRGLNWLTQSDNTTLISTAELLHFTQANNVTYLPGFQTVRWDTFPFDLLDETIH